MLRLKMGLDLNFEEKEAKEIKEGMVCGGHCILEREKAPKLTLVPGVENTMQLGVC